MRRGFKTWCEKEAAAIRKIMGLKDFDALSWVDLSKHMGIPVLDGASLPIEEKDRDQLFQKDHKSWDAFTVTVDDGKHMIFFNSKQPTPRITNTIMHELAHIICEHVPSTIMNMGLPVRTCDTKQGRSRLAVR
jgi:Zn-dependent peptidase ImmA (M78 family)